MYGWFHCPLCLTQISEPGANIDEIVFHEKRNCIMSCEGKVDGDYQLCHKCNHFASCSNGQLYEMPCALGENGLLVWDDTTRRCERNSSTCEVEDIDGCR